MKRIAIACVLAAAASGAYAATTMPSAPAESWTVTNYYKQAVYDPKESKIGDIDDVLVDKSGKVTGLVIGVGGFLGAGEKDVIVPFNGVKTEKKNDKWWLTLDETKDGLEKAPGFTYDKASTTWAREEVTSKSQIRVARRASGALTSFAATLPRAAVGRAAF